MSTKHDKNKPTFYYLSMGMASGLITGTVLGVVFNDTIIGSSLGFLVGMIVGLFIEFNKGNISKENLLTSLKILLIAIIGSIAILLVPMLFS